MQLEVKENSAHNPKITNIQEEVKENRAHNTKVTNIKLQVKKNSAHNTKVDKQSNRSQRKRCAKY